MNSENTKILVELDKKELEIIDNLIDQYNDKKNDSDALLNSRNEIIKSIISMYPDIVCECSNYSDIIEDLEEANKRYQDDINRYQNDMDRYQNEISRYQSETIKQENSLMNENDKYKDEVKKLKEENLKYKTLVDRSYNEIINYRDEIKKLKEENSKLKKENKSPKVTNNKKPIEMTVSTK